MEIWGHELICLQTQRISPSPCDRRGSDTVNLSFIPTLGELGLSLHFT